MKNRPRVAARVAGFVTSTSIMLPSYLAARGLAAEGERDAVRDRWTRRWCDSLLRIFGIDLDVIGDADHQRGRGRLVVSNHRGVIDVAILLRSFGGFMVSRADLASWPLVGAAARATGTLFVDRKDSMSGAQIIRSIREQLNRGHTVTLFPEGTTFAGDEVHPFHAGAFLAALRQDVDIVPVGIAYQTGSKAAFVDETFPEHLAKMAGADRSRAVLSVGSPIPAKDVRKAALLAERAQAAVVAEVARARAAVDARR
ncbi:lysophospholipid acyltransferase family protein [soil metagenome]